MDHVLMAPHRSSIFSHRMHIEDAFREDDI